MRVGVLALQGAFIEHQKMLEKLNIVSFQIRQWADLESQMDGLIIPGGESTVIGKLLVELNLLVPLRELISNGLPVFGTCAGLILLSREIAGGEQSGIGTMDIVAVRNAYGRQLGSFFVESEVKGIGSVPMTFIRAPYIQSAKDNVKVLAKVDGNIVAARQCNQLVTAFHPELNHDTSVHQYFINMIEQNSLEQAQ